MSRSTDFAPLQAIAGPYRRGWPAIWRGALDKLRDAIRSLRA